jgi:hypothetical protein
VDERRELSGKDHDAKDAAKWTRAASDLVERPHEKRSASYAVYSRCVRGGQVELPQHQGD